MSTETQTPSVTVADSWQGGLLAGGIAAAVMAAVMALLPPLRPVLFGAIPALYGVAPPAPVVGIVVHVVHGAIFGLGFVALADALDVTERGRSTALGLAYGTGLFLVGAAVLMPLWLGAVGFPKAPPLPNLKPPILVLHLLYGGLLGVTVPSLTGS